MGRTNTPASSFCLVYISELYIYLEWQVASKKWSQRWRKLTCSASPFLLFLSARLTRSRKKWAKISCFYFDWKSNARKFWTLLHRFLDVIVRHFGFSFHMNDWSSYSRGRLYEGWIALSTQGLKNVSWMPYEIVLSTAKRVYVSTMLTYDFLNFSSCI